MPTDTPPTPDTLAKLRDLGPETLDDWIAQNDTDKERVGRRYNQLDCHGQFLRLARELLWPVKAAVVAAASDLEPGDRYRVLVNGEAVGPYYEIARVDAQAGQGTVAVVHASGGGATHDPATPVLIVDPGEEPDRVPCPDCGGDETVRPFCGRCQGGTIEAPWMPNTARTEGDRFPGDTIEETADALRGVG